MKINNFAAGSAVVAVLAGQVSADPACPENISALAAVNPLEMLIDNCVKTSSDISIVNEANYDALSADCLNPLASEGGSSFPASTGTGLACRKCYQAFAESIVELSVGSFDGSDIVPPAISIVPYCQHIISDAEREECYKNDDVIVAMQSFQTCAGYSLVYPAEGTLRHRHLLNEHGIYELLVRTAFSNELYYDNLYAYEGDYDPVVRALVYGDDENPATGDDLLTEVCYRLFFEYLELYSDNAEPSIMNSCGSVAPTDKDCYDTQPLKTARARFADCAGFEIDEAYDSCTADELSALKADFDAYGDLVKVVIASYDLDEDHWDTAVEKVLDEITAVTGSDCMYCFHDLAHDIAAEIEKAKTTYSTDALLKQFLSSCDDPTKDSCLVVIGTVALNNFKDCAGVNLDRSKFAPVTATEAPTTTAAPTTAAETTTAEPTTAKPTTKGAAATVSVVAGAVLAVALSVL